MLQLSNLALSFREPQAMQDAPTGCLNGQTFDQAG
jgi:hypothetical protein